MKPTLLLSLVLIATTAFAQKEVAITLDDVPNAQVLQSDKFSSRLLASIDKLALPVTIFINEGNIYQTPHLAENFNVLLQWLGDKNITAGNHTFSHSSYSRTNVASFRDDVVKGETITQGALKQQGKPLRYFRFPFNDMGKDSVEHATMKNLLLEKGYTVAPFTVESSDWAYSAVYEAALARNDLAKAKQTGTAYVAFTLQLFQHFEKLCQQQFGRAIKQIYLCHDNALNRDYLPILIQGLKQQGYTFISLHQALTDKVYAMPEYYFGNAGFSWIYRWQKDATQRKAMLRAEPEDEAMLKDHQQLQQKP